MSTVVVNPLDANWRILQVSKEKPVTPRGRSRQFGGPKHRSRREEQLSHRERESSAAMVGKPAKGGRHEVLERIVRSDNDDLEEIEARRTRAAQKRCRQVAKAQRETINVVRLENAQRRRLRDSWLYELQEALRLQAAHRLAAILGNPECLEDAVRALEEDAEVGDHLTAYLLEATLVGADLLYAA
jgi:hypothetical protein